MIKDKHIHIKVTEEEKALFLEKAKSMGFTLSQYARYALKNFKGKDIKTN